MKQLFKSLLAISIAALCINPVFADDKTTKSPTLLQVLEASGIKISGYVDTSYTYLSGSGTFNPSVPPVLPAVGIANRVFDTERNSFNLNMVNLSISMLPAEGFGGMVDLSMGSDARAITSAGTVNDEFDVTQGYVQYASGPFTTIAGKYVTLAGAEVIRGPDNLNVSRSILFGYAIPFTHTGVRSSFAVGDRMKFIVGINNGWDVLRESASTVGGLVADGKTIELGAQFTPIKPLNILIAAYSGEEPGFSAIGRRDLLDIVVSLAFTENLSVILNADIGQQEDALAVGTDAEWSGIAAYLNWKFADQWRIALRAEAFNDKDGFRTGVNTGTGGQTWSEASVTLAYLAGANAEIRLEGRYDKSDVDNAFNQTDGSTDDNQHSVGLQGIYKF